MMVMRKRQEEESEFWLDRVFVFFPKPESEDLAVQAPKLRLFAEMELFQPTTTKKSDIGQFLLDGDVHIFLTFLHLFVIISSASA